MAEKEENRYVSDNAQLMAEWNYELNKNFSPNTLGLMSHKKVWWRCKMGHEWESSISKRSQGQGCPYCSGRRPIAGQTDLATTHPKLASEWHPSKNTLSPTQITAGSGKKIWWRCSKGHEWEAIVGNRTSKNRGCPFCSGRNVTEGETDLQSRYPELSKEWHPTKNNTLSPSNVSPGSHKKVWWKCNKGHEWQAQIKSRVNGAGCPICSNQKVLPGYNDLLSQDPEIAKDWHPTKNGALLPNQVLVGTDKKVWWQCRKGHEWYASIVSRHRTRCGCPQCNCETQTSFPEQAILFYVKKQTETQSRVHIFGREIDIYLPKLQVGIEYNGAYFHKNKHKDQEKILFFAKKGIKIFSINEGTQNAICGDTIEYIYHSTKKESLNWAIKELIGLIGLQTLRIDSEIDANSIYSQYLALEKENSLAAKYPNIASEWHPSKNGNLTPNLFSFGSGKKVWWRCSKGHEWLAPIYSRTAGNNCPICAGRKLLTGFNDLQTLYPNIALEWHPNKNGPLTPNNILSGSHKKVWWRCENEHEWETTVVGRTSKNSGCPYCLGIKPLNGYNDLMTANLRLANEWNYEKNNGLTPSDVMPNSKKKVWWKCNCGNEWQATIDSRSRGTGCPQCARKRTIAAKFRSVINLDTLEVFPSLKAAAEKYNGTGGGILNACTGRAKTAYGYRWAYLDNMKPRKKSK
ncbi:MAG: zinc-ribbon domain-containing protein [Clostridia bacterium]|nr:zinc-ribbon domain-containing protein [Clostridia bacterium]